MLIHSCQTALSNYISHEICIKQNCLFATSYNTLKNLWSLEKTCNRWQNQSIFFFKNQLHGNISLRFGLASRNIYFKKCFPKCLTDLFDDVTQNWNFFCFPLKKIISMNRCIVPNLVNLWRFRKIRCKLSEIHVWKPKFADQFTKKCMPGGQLAFVQIIMKINQTSS